MENTIGNFAIRNAYPEFIFESFHVDHNAEGFHVEYVYKLGEHTFRPTVEIPITDINIETLNNKFLDYLFFNYGIANAISYYKLALSPKFVIKAGKLDNLQKAFFKKLFYNGLGELMYVNRLDIPYEQFMEIVAEDEPQKPEWRLSDDFSGHLIPVGGGKDSIVTLETLQPFHKDNICFQYNRDIYPANQAAIDSIKLAGYSLDSTADFNVTLDEHMLELNKQGFYNGHIPFSSCLAFAAYIVAYLNNKKFIVLSNEASANEGNIAGSKINHQYSKSFEFENDFQNYTRSYFSDKIYYFSLLRCLNEYQITQRFIRHPRYLNIFRSCNVGTHENKWCGACAKCLYVYIMLYPHVGREKMMEIFGYDMFENYNLEGIMNGLVNPDATKPFDCVGTREEIAYSLKLAIDQFPPKAEFPYLLQWYRKWFYNPTLIAENVTNYFNSEHHIPEKYLELIMQ